VFRIFEHRSADWNAIGRQLGVSLNYRNGLKRDVVISSIDEKLENMIHQWAESKPDDVTWSTVKRVLSELQFNDVHRELMKREQQQPAV